MKPIHILLFLLISQISISQNGNRDSLFQLLDDSQNMKEKSILYSQLSKTYEKNQLDSAIYYANLGLKLADSIRYDLGVAENAVDLGTYNIKQNNLNQAKINYTAARVHYKKTDSLFNYTQNSLRLGNINLAQDNYIEALNFYQESLIISKENSFKELLPHLYNNIGLVYKQMEEYDDAQANFQDAYRLFLENKDEDNLVYPLYNISLIESLVGNDQEAIEGYLNLTSYHLKSENWVSLGSVYNSISVIYLKKKDYARAQEYLEMALNAMEDKIDTFNSGPSSLSKSQIYSNAANLYFIQGNFIESKKYAYKALNLSLNNSYQLQISQNGKILASIYDNAKQVDSALFYHKLYSEYNEKYRDEQDVKQLTKLKMQREFDDILKENEIERIYKEASYKNKELKYIGITVSALFLVIILVLLYFNLKNKNIKLALKEENLRLEKKKLNQDLEYKKKELASNMMFLMEKNEFITTISKKLIELKPDAKKDNKELLQQIINEIRINSSTKVWEEFELRFKEVHTEFYNNLNIAHPDLTLNETKICAFLRLNMSTKEISAITHQSVKSINMARFRLRKKINVDRDENLISYLNSL